MTDYISREAFIADKKWLYCTDCDRRKGKKRGKMVTLYEIGEAPCKSCGIHEMLEEVEAYPAADVRPKWISVEERLPELHDAEYLDEVTGELIRYKESKPILIWLAKGGFMDIGIYEKSDSVDDFCYQGVPHTVTYWMPLPEAPNCGEKLTEGSE